MPNHYKLKATHEFWKAFGRLSGEQKKLAKEAFKIFKANPFDQRLRPHKINRLTSLYKSPVLSVTAGDDLRAVFVIKGEQIISFDIGTHDIYK